MQTKIWGDINDRNIHYINALFYASNDFDYMEELMEKSYTIEFYHTYVVTVGASNEENAADIAEGYISEDPSTYLTSIDYQIKEYGWW